MGLGMFVCVHVCCVGKVYSSFHFAQGGGEGIQLLAIISFVHSPPPPAMVRLCQPKPF